MHISKSCRLEKEGYQPTRIAYANRLRSLASAIPVKIFALQRGNVFRPRILDCHASNAMQEIDLVLTRNCSKEDLQGHWCP